MLQRDPTGPERPEPQERQELNWLRVEFVSAVARQLSTPLSLIKIYSEALLSRPLDEARQRQLMVEINQQSARMAGIMADWRDVLQVDAEHNFALTLQQVDTFELLNSVLASLAALTSEHQVKVIGFSEGNVRALADAYWLARAARSLLLNAIKNAPTGSTITIRQQVSEQGVEISVRHEVEDQPRAVQVTHTAIGGPELGLAASALIVELHNGNLWTANDSAETTTFITLPLADSTLGQES